jgi:hypothetical protein
MILGAAIIIAMILFLIDRNHVWPQTWQLTKKILKVSAGLTLLAAIAFGIWLALDNYQDKKRNAENARAGVSPHAGAVDCYDSQGNLMPDEAKAFDGWTSGCGPNQTAKPLTERANIPIEMRQHVERIEACEKRAAEDPKDNPSKFQACLNTK